jgi:hypothetical protein
MVQEKVTVVTEVTAKLDHVRSIVTLLKAIHYKEVEYSTTIVFYW